MPKKVDISDIKKALKDPRFRDSLGVKFQEDVSKYLTNPGCSCNNKLYKRIVTEGKNQLLKYFPDSEVSEESIEVKNSPKNYFTVINCHKDDLQDRLRKLPMGRKQIAVTRYEDEVTAIINEVDYQS